MRTKKSVFIVYFAVIFILSATLLLAFQYKDQNQIELLFSLSLSGLLAFIGSAIATLVLPTVPKLEATTPRIILTALRIVVIAVLTSFLGGGLAFAGFITVGRIVAVGGIIVGIISMFIYFAAIIFRQSKN
jgi:hypothetical protein